MNLFIAGVGNVELFKGTKSVLVSKTLVDSSINLSVSLEDIRAGAGAKLYGKYAHSSGMTMKLTDAMFRMEFLAANIGADVELGGTAVASVQKLVAAGAVDIAGLEPQPLYPGAETVVWIGKAGATEFVPFVIGEDNADSIEVSSYFADGDKICVRYIKANDGGETLTVSANFIPDTMTAILTAPLFAGDNANLETSTKVGTLTITIPRFMLNGTTDLSMTMTGAAQMGLEGSALAVESTDCDGEGYYAVISKVITGASIVDGLMKIGTNFTEDFTRAEILATPLEVMGYYSGIGARKIPSDEIVVTGTGVTYNATTGMISTETETLVEVTVSVKDAPATLTPATFEIPATE